MQPLLWLMLKKMLNSSMMKNQKDILGKFQFELYSILNNAYLILL